MIFFAKVFKILCVIAVGLAFLFSMYVLFVYVPIGIYTESECLRKGYPKYAISIGLERYCMNLDGNITVKVQKAKTAP